jgi:hypothetical protein
VRVPQSVTDPPMSSPPPPLGIILLYFSRDSAKFPGFGLSVQKSAAGTSRAPSKIAFSRTDAQVLLYLERYIVHNGLSMLSIRLYP